MGEEFKIKLRWSKKSPLRWWSLSKHLKELTKWGYSWRRTRSEFIADILMSKGWTVNLVKAETIYVHLYLQLPEWLLPPCRSRKNNVWIEIKAYSTLCLSLSRYISHFQVNFLRRNITNRQLSERWQISIAIQATYSILSALVK